MAHHGHAHNWIVTVDLSGLELDLEVAQAIQAIRVTLIGPHGEEFEQTMPAQGIEANPPRTLLGYAFSEAE